MAKSKNRVAFARNTIIAFITVVAILMLGFGTYVSTGMSTPSEISDGRDYITLENARGRRAGDPITVVEYFAYNCVHCKNFDPMLDDWSAQQTDDIVVSKRPVAWSPIQTVLGQTYLTLEAAEVIDENHGRIFRAIHDGKRQFLTPDMMADYVDGRGISKADFLRTFNSPAVKREMRKVAKEQQDLQISATPSLVVAGRYVVGMSGGQKRALEVVDFLIQKERAGDT